VRHRRGEHERRDLVGGQPDFRHLEALEIDHVAAVFERVILVGRDVADRNAELEEVGLVALECAQAGFRVDRLVRDELLADLAVGHGRTRAEQDHHEIEQPLAAIAAPLTVATFGGLRALVLVPRSLARHRRVFLSRKFCEQFVPHGS
jgi:hypothetical protein